MSLTYNSFVSEIAALTVISSTVLVNGDNNFAGIMPGIIDYAEGRLYRELDLPVVSVIDTTTTCTSGNRAVSLSTDQGEILVITSLNLLTMPASAPTVRLPLLPVAQAVLDNVYPSQVGSAATVVGTPTYFSRLGNTELLLGPAPDQPYPLSHRHHPAKPAIRVQLFDL